MQRLAKLFKFPHRPEPVADDPKPAPHLVVMRRPVKNPLTDLGDRLRSEGRNLAETTNALSESEADRNHLQRLAFRLIDDLNRPFDPALNDEDRQLLEDIATFRQRREELRDDVKRGQALHDKLERELPPPPGIHQASAVVVAAATFVLGAGFGTSIYPLFEVMDDAVLAMGLALALGLALGALITWAVLSLEEEK